jgi:hypothetical protein
MAQANNMRPEKKKKKKIILLSTRRKVTFLLKDLLFPL